MVDVVARTAAQVFIPFTVGGGVRTPDDARRLLRAGADKVAVNTAAVLDPRPRRASWPTSSARSAWWSPSTPGTAPRERTEWWEVFTHGGRTETGRTRWRGPISALDSVRVRSSSRRWTATARAHGFDLELTRAIVDTVGVPVVASGGVGNLDHLVEGAIAGGADAVLAASIFHRQEYTVAEAKAYLAAHGVAVRPPSSM